MKKRNHIFLIHVPTPDKGIYSSLGAEGIKESARKYPGQNVITAPDAKKHDVDVLMRKEKTYD